MQASTYVADDARRGRKNARTPEAREETADDHGLDGLSQRRRQREEYEASEGDEEDWPPPELLREWSLDEGQRKSGAAQRRRSLGGKLTKISGPAAKPSW